MIGTAQKACILYGFAEGQRHGVRMRRALKARGYRVVRRPHAADLIIAHSGGYLMLPKLKPEQRVLIIDASYRPKRSPLYCFVIHVWYDILDLAIRPRNTVFWLWKSLLNLYYMVVHLPRHTRLYRRYKRIDFHTVVSGPHTVITQSEDVSWFDPSAFPPEVRARIYYVEAGHDDCWRHPETYLDFVEDD